MSLLVHNETYVEVRFGIKLSAIASQYRKHIQNCDLSLLLHFDIIESHHPRVFASNYYIKTVPRVIAVTAIYINIHYSLCYSTHLQLAE